MPISLRCRHSRNPGLCNCGEAPVHNESEQALPPSFYEQRDCRAQERERLHAVVLAAVMRRDAAHIGPDAVLNEHALSTAPPTPGEADRSATGGDAPSSSPTPLEQATTAEAAAAEPLRAIPPRLPMPPEPPRMALREAVELVQAAERGRQARERVAALQLARRRNDAQQRIRAAGTVGFTAKHTA